MTDTQQIAVWLDGVGLKQYADCFAENDIDFSILYDLTDQDLEKIGVRPLGHRRKLLRAIEELRTGLLAGKTAAASALQQAGVGRRQLTLMFCDVVGSTALSTQLSNSYVLRQRQIWAQAALNSGLTVTGGQMWSLVPW